MTRLRATLWAIVMLVALASAAQPVVTTGFEPPVPSPEPRSETFWNYVSNVYGGRYGYKATGMYGGPYTMKAYPRTAAVRP